MSQRDREGRLAFINRLPHNQRTYPSDCEAEARKSRPLWGKVAPTGDGRGGTRSQTKTAPQPTHLPQRLQSRSPKKPSPLGEGGRREPDGRGELALNLRLPHNQRTHPKNCRSKKQHQIRKAIQPCKRAPPHRALTGPPPTQRGRLNYSP